MDGLATPSATAVRGDRLYITDGGVAEPRGRLKRDGIDGSGVATLMKDAGSTNGAFYAHFASKESLVAIAIADQLRTLHANIVAQAQPGPACLADGPAMTSRPAHLDRRPRPCG